MTPRDSTLDPMRPGTTLGPYRLAERLDHGGMGEVWHATHTRLDRAVAIKLIRPESLEGSEARRDEVLERFEREARATSALTSPHTVQLFDFGRSPGGGFYYAMELLEGFTLDALVAEEGPVHPARAVHVLRQACDSLGEAHERGLIHRDVKPNNLFLCRRGLRHDFVKVLDFGLVRELDHGPEHLTRSDQLLGSPAFMPPELVQGVHELDARSDVYGLGCVAYWLLTGCLVFDHDHFVRMALAHANEAPPPPSTRTDLTIPARLEALVLACLEKRPETRPRDARALRDALDDCGIEPAWTEAEAERWWRFHRGGSTDRITLDPPAAREPAPGPVRVLVVDDEPAVRLVVARLLTQAGYEVLPASSGMEALDLLATRELDVVLTDLRMPGLGGMGLVAEIAARAPNLPVIVLTAHGSVPTAVEAMRAGARDFVMKPFDRDGLCLAIEKARGGAGCGSWGSGST